MLFTPTLFQLCYLTHVKHLQNEMQTIVPGQIILQTLQGLRIPQENILTKAP